MRRLIEGELRAAWEDDGRDRAPGGVGDRPRTPDPLLIEFRDRRVEVVAHEVGAEIVAHAAVVARELHVGGRPVRTGYVEAVATDPHRQGNGFGSRVMTE